jgi:hypothetical protein
MMTLGSEIDSNGYRKCSGNVAPMMQGVGVGLQNRPKTQLRGPGVRTELAEKRRIVDNIVKIKNR